MKKSLKNSFIPFCMFSVLISFEINAGAAQNNPPNPPIKQTETSTLPESINACVGKNEGDNCTFNQNNEKAIGTCKKNNEGKMNCNIAK